MIMITYYLSSPPQILRFPGVQLELRGLVYNIIGCCASDSLVGFAFPVPSPFRGKERTTKARAWRMADPGQK
jgi:hypothetical protein